MVFGVFLQSEKSEKDIIKKNFKKAYSSFKKNPPKIIVGIINVGANANATCRFGARQEIM